MGFWSSTFGGGNSFSESLANVTTPGDDYEYRGGNLYDISGGGQKLVKGEDRGGKTSYGTLGQADSKGSGLYYPTNVGGGEGPGAGKQSVRNTSGFNAGLGSVTRNPVFMGGLGLISGGIAPAITAGAMAAGRRNMYNNTAKPDPLTNQQIGIDKTIRSIEDMGPSTYTKDELTKIREGKNRIEGSYYKDGQGDKQFKMNMFGNSYEINPETGNSKLIEDQAAAAGGDNDGIAAVRRSVGTQATAPTNIMPAISTESEFAKQQVLSPPAEWLIANGYADTNPSYDALVKYNTDLRAGVLTMSEGGRLGQMQMRQIGPNAGSGIGRQMEMGGLQQYGAYLDNRYGDPEFDQKKMQFLRDVNQQEQQTFGGGGGGSFPSSGLGGKGGAGSSTDRLIQPLNELTGNATKSIENGFGNNVEPPEQAPTNSLYKGLSPVFGGAMGGARAALGMAEGGDVEFALGGNEKDLINAMEDVVRKDLADDGEFNPANISDEDKIVIAQFVQQYGVDAIPRLVKKIQDGSIDETRERFARGENGVVRGNGDGSGVDDMVTAQLKDGDATQDVLLADGEFVLRKDAYEALKGAGVNVDKVNDAGSNAAKELNKMMTA